METHDCKKEGGIDRKRERAREKVVGSERRRREGKGECCWEGTTQLQARERGCEKESERARAKVVGGEERDAKTPLQRWAREGREREDEDGGWGKCWREKGTKRYVEYAPAATRTER